MEFLTAGTDPDIRAGDFARLYDRLRGTPSLAPRDVLASDGANHPRDRPLLLGETRCLKNQPIETAR